VGHEYTAAMSHEERMKAAGIELPAGYPPAGLYVSAVRTGNLLHVGGHGPVRSDGSRITGKVGAEVSLELAQEAARLTGLQILRSIRDELGSLDRVARVVKVFGMVNCAPGFNQTPAVINGCSQLFHDVFGDAGVHTRSAVGMAELPFDISVEIEAIVELAGDE
jgi:enamine deaminase RidA (YjgF/YER057c/UK114 family)